MAVRLPPGVADLQGSADDKTVTVSFDEAQTDVASISRILTDVGYPPET